MRILYAIQGTGNGHISRARDIIPILKNAGKLDILISGTEAEVELPYPIKYKLKGMSFVFGKNGGVDLFATYKKSSLRRFYKEYSTLPVENYDIIISDFEPVSAWACRLRNKACIGLSHQIAVTNKNAPKPKKKDPVGKAVLKYYAPVTKQYGFHFKEYDSNVFSPVIRKEIRDAESVNNGHYTVYLPAYSDKKIMKILNQMTEIKWEVFSKHSKKAYKEFNVKITPIDNEKFIKSLLSCEGILCGAGFETPAEALHLKKKLLVIPMKGQYEQQCNAAALKEMGVKVIKSLKQKNLGKIKDWVTSPATEIPVNYLDTTESILNSLIKEEIINRTIVLPELGNKPISIDKFKSMTLERILGKVSG
jgi:uncharacterized protein (TIGR00661 family)